jgi:hypothetical protein
MGGNTDLDPTGGTDSETAEDGNSSEYSAANGGCAEVPSTSTNYRWLRVATAILFSAFD